MLITIDVSEHVLGYDGSPQVMAVPPKEPGMQMTTRPVEFRDVMAQALDAYAHDEKKDRKFALMRLGIELFVKDEVSLDETQWDDVLEACSRPTTTPLAYGRIRMAIEEAKEKAQAAVDAARRADD